MHALILTWLVKSRHVSIEIDRAFQIFTSKTEQIPNKEKNG